MAKHRQQRDQDPAPPRHLIQSYRDFHILRAYDGDVWERDVFFYISKDDEIFWGFTTRPLSRLVQWKAALKRLPDSEIYPKFPETTHLTKVARESAAPELVHVKRPRLQGYYDDRNSGSDFSQRQLLHEASMLEKVAGPKAKLPPHPNIIRYYGCRVNRGYITGLVFERLQYSLDEYAREPGFHTLDKRRFFLKLTAAIDYVHSLGLAHNDISPYNVMVRETANGQAEPVLIDFGSCAPFGSDAGLTLGTPGWYEEPFSTSEKKHDTYSLSKVEEWLETRASSEGA
ncbi:kinase-like domain-containing protein [Aspergillus carlsbadensis]|nr:kinase-like domain-containing protein [Aspergillus carlsbadensis]